jgi:PIN domain nuclease of toxin-antitoxin system
MKLLLDTHTFIWWDSDPRKLSKTALSSCQNPDNTLILSVVSIWEMQIKLQLGKLQLNQPLPEIIDSQRQENNLQFLPVTIDHVLALDSLPFHHKDPFDRLLISQAIVENATLVSVDSRFTNYPVAVIW